MFVTNLYDYKFVNKNNNLYILEASEVDDNNDDFFINYIAYHKDTPDDLIKILENIRKNNKRVRLFYGDQKTGECWHEQYDIMGTISETTGKLKIPILIANNRSVGGTGILTDCIVQITEDKKIIYKNEKLSLNIGYVMDDNNEFDVIDRNNSKTIIHTKTKESAVSMVNFFSGVSNSYQY
jgi:hypothetical protein